MVGAIIYVLVIVYFVIVVKNKKKAVHTQHKKNTINSAKTTEKEMVFPEPKAGKPKQKKSSTLNRADFEEVPLRGRKKDVAVSKMMEDREHDWLARQLSDERRAFRKCSEMFDLKMSHHYSCEAEALKRFHEENCDAEMVDNPAK